MEFVVITIIIFVGFLIWLDYKKDNKSNDLETSQKQWLENQLKNNLYQISITKLDNTVLYLDIILPKSEIIMSSYIIGKTSYENSETLIKYSYDRGYFKLKNEIIPVSQIKLVKINKVDTTNN